MTDRRWLIFCEAEADFRTASFLIDQVLLLRCSPWVRDLYEQDPAHVRRWRGLGDDSEWFKIHDIYAVARSLGVRPRHGHFDGRPGRAGAMLLATVMRIHRSLAKRAEGDEVLEAVVFVWDMDNQGSDRRAGIAQAAGQCAGEVTLVVACPDPKREAWVLAGFVPRGAGEGELLAEVRHDLGFCPTQAPQDLLATADGAIRNAKEVCRRLGLTSWDRESECLRIADEDAYRHLTTAGEHCGLKAFLESVAAHLVPLVDSGSRSGASP